MFQVGSGSEKTREAGYLVHTDGKFTSFAKDMAVLGSYLGLIPLSMLKDRAQLDLTLSARLISKHNGPLVTNVESVVLGIPMAAAQPVRLLSDNDDGSSAYFALVLTLRPKKRP